MGPFEFPDFRYLRPTLNSENTITRVSWRVFFDLYIASYNVNFKLELDKGVQNYEIINIDPGQLNGYMFFFLLCQIQKQL